MSSFTERFNRQFQDNFLSHLLRDTTFLESVSRDISPEFFPEEAASRLVRVILYFYEQYSAAPDTNVFQILEQDKQNRVLTEDQHSAVSMLADELFQFKLQNKNYLLGQFNEFCRLQKYRAELPKLQELLERGKLDTADEILADVLAFRTGQAGEMGRFYSPQEISERSERRAEEDEKRLLTFIPELDELIPGLGPANLNLIQSRLSSDGKTAFLTMLARSFAFQGANTLIFTVGDMTEEEYEDRLDMCFAGLTKEQLVNDQITAEAVRKLYKFRGKIHVKEMPYGATTVPHLRAYVERLSAATSFTPDVLIIDYADCLGPENSAARGNLAATTLDVYSGIKQWVQESRIGCWTAGQSNRSAGDVTFAEQNHVAGGIDKVRIADTIISIARDNQEETNIKITKSRHAGARGQVISIPTDFSRMQFYDGRHRREGS